MNANLASVAVAFPRTIRTNDYWRDEHPLLVETAHDRALSRLWARERAESSFERAMAPWQQDPFKGALERRVVDDEGSLDLAVAAARDAVVAAGLDVSEIDLVFVSSMRPDTHAVGDAAFLVRRLGFRCPAINLETACSSSVVGVDLACALIRGGRHRNVLVVSTCTYSRDIDPADTMAWFLGDGAGALVVRASERPGWLGSKTVHTAETCGAFVHDLVIEGDAPRLKMSASKGAGTILHDTARPLLEACCCGAVESAGLTFGQIDFVVFNTPTAWYADFGAEVLGIARERTISTYPIYTNIGPALMPVNLFHALTDGRINAGDNVLLYAVGSASTASAVVLRMAQCGLGPAPAPPATRHFVR